MLLGSRMPQELGILLDSPTPGALSAWATLTGLGCIAIAALLGYLFYRTRDSSPRPWGILLLALFLAVLGFSGFVGSGPVGEVKRTAGIFGMLTAAASLFSALTLLILLPRMIAAAGQGGRDTNPAGRNSDFAQPGTAETALDDQDRDAARDKLTEFEQFQSQLFLRDATSVAFWEWTLDTDEVVYAGDVGSIFGHTGQTATLQEFMARLHPDDRVAVREAIDQAILERTEFDMEFRTLRPDGSTHWLVGRGRVHYGEDNRPVRMLGVSLDVTRRKHMERVLRNSEKLAATGRLASVIAHEINNPLESLTNLLYLLQEDSSLDPNGRKYVAMMQEELQRIGHITHETLGFYRDSSAPVAIKLHEVVQSVVDVYQRKIYKNRVKIETQFESDRAVAAFPGEMRQVISNLLLNAIEVSPEEGRVSVRVSASCDWRNMTQGGVRVTIVDQGPGIAVQNKKRIFDPFFTTKSEKGSGLGLWVSQGIINRHGGSIAVHSSHRAERSGTAFSFFIPG